MLHKDITRPPIAKLCVAELHNYCCFRRWCEANSISMTSSTCTSRHQRLCLGLDHAMERNFLLPLLPTMQQRGRHLRRARAYSCTRHSSSHAALPVGLRLHRLLRRRRLGAVGHGCRPWRRQAGVPAVLGCWHRQEQTREREKTRRDGIRRRQDMGDNAKLHAMLSCHVSQRVLTKQYGPAVYY